MTNETNIYIILGGMALVGTAIGLWDYFAERQAQRRSKSKRF